MIIARDTIPKSVAINSIKNANNPADSVPNPLLNPLQKVAPIIEKP